MLRFYPVYVYFYDTLVSLLLCGFISQVGIQWSRLPSVGLAIQLPLYGGLLVHSVRPVCVLSSVLPHPPDAETQSLYSLPCSNLSAAIDIVAVFMSVEKRKQVSCIKRF